MSDTVRVLRLLCYEGDREWVENTVKNSIHGTQVVVGQGKITAVTLGDFPEILETQQQNQEKET